MKLITWLATDTEALFGTMEAPTNVNIVPISHTQDASEYLGLSFEAVTPVVCAEITNVPADTFYFTYKPIMGHWATNELALMAAKELRDAELEKIVVEVDGILLDGNEKAQERMTRAAFILGDTGSTPDWKTADNQFVNVTGAQFKQAVALAGQAQSALWRKYSL